MNSGNPYPAAESFRKVLFQGPYRRIDQLLEIVGRDTPRLLDILIQDAALDSQGQLILPSFFILNGETSVYGMYSFWTMVSLSDFKGLWFYNLESLSFDFPVTGEPFVFPPGLERCPSLRSLSLKNTGLHNFPEEILKLRCLRSLDISSNKIDHIPPGIGRLRQLVYFNASDNGLKDLPYQIGGLKKLQILNLSGNRIESLGFSLTGLTSLKTLNLSGNCLGKIPEGLETLIQIEKVHLAYNDLTAEDEAAWEEGDFSGIPSYQWHFSF